MRYFVVDAFTNQSFGGNPAGVVLLESDRFPEEKLMLQIAAELRYSETAFIRRHSDKEYTIRYFTPKAEVELCGHATIASFYLLNHEGLVSRSCLCHTLAGDLRIEARERVMMQMAMPRIVATIKEKEEIYKALGVNDYHPVMPIQIAYSGLPDLMIPLPSFHVFAFANDDYTAHVRDFGPLYGVPEESATGTANAALTFYLQHNGCLGAEAECAFMQGEAMGRPSVVTTQIRKDGTIYVGGTAVIVAKGEFVVNQ